MIDKHIDVNLCYGCDSCVQICPKKCIELRANEFGMSYPYVDQRKCIKCGQCLLVCPSINSEIKIQKKLLLNLLQVEHLQLYAMSLLKMYKNIVYGGRLLKKIH
jgi:ferredoxin